MTQVGLEVVLVTQAGLEVVQDIALQIDVWDTHSYPNLIRNDVKVSHFKYLAPLLLTLSLSDSYSITFKLVVDSSEIIKRSCCNAAFSTDVNIAAAIQCLVCISTKIIGDALTMLPVCLPCTSN